MTSEQQRTRGRPRKWANDAERKRAYRQRRLAELAEPLRLREEARAARARAAAARDQTETAVRAAEASKRRAIAAERRAARARLSVARARLATASMKEQRDRVVRALNRRIPLHGGVERYIDDPDALLAIASGLVKENEQLRDLLDEVLSSSRQRTGRSVWDD